MRALSAIDLVPAAAVDRDRLLEVAHPQLAIDRRRASEEPVARRLACESLIHHHINFLPGRKVPQRDRVLVGLLVGHALQVGRLAEERRDGAIELGERRDCREQPTVTHRALVDVTRVDVADDLERGHIAHAHAAPRAEWGVACVMQRVALEGHHVGGRVHIAGYHLGHRRERLVVGHQDRERAVGMALRLVPQSALTMNEAVLLVLFRPVDHVTLVLDREVLARLLA